MTAPAWWTSVMTWLKAKLGNSWMNDSDYGFFMAHSGWAGGSLACFAFVKAGTANAMRSYIYWTLAWVVAAFLKEYVYDANFETPKQTFKDNTQDFLGYLAGMALVWIVIGLHLRGVL